MIFFKLKSLFFSLMAILAITVLMTSCEQESLDFIVEDEVSGFLPAEEAGDMITNYDATNLPEGLPSPDEVLEWSLNEKNSALEGGEVGSRGVCGCSTVFRYKVNSCGSMFVDWKSQNNLALFVYHYRANGNVYLGYTRINPTSTCTFTCSGFSFCPSGNNGWVKSVAFMGSGYTTCSSKTAYWYDN